VAVGAFAVAIAMVGPTLIAHGTHEQQERFLDPMLRGDEVWCQLFSEPGAGSDLAGLSTRAERDGDEFVVNGQKVWNSGAQHSEWGILLARTDPTVPKHKGITYFVVDMATAGVEVRPLRQITGHAHFNETFLTDVRIPADGVVGEVNGGWGVTLTTLLNERAFIAGASAGQWEQILGIARAFGRTDEPVIRQALARHYCRRQALAHLGQRVQTATSQGRMPGPEAMTMKLAFSLQAHDMGNLLMALEGPAATLYGADASATAFAQDMFLGQWSTRIGGGTDEVQRNIIGERALGLPREPRLDKDVPFNELPR
jgi:alkylation response protein AidB-like acyl-CoA dehydrogenase